MATELANDKLIMNSRNQCGDVHAGVISINSKGGESCDNTYFHRTLPDPVTKAHINSREEREKSVVAFCNAADTERRDNLTLRISYADGKTW